MGLVIYNVKFHMFHIHTLSMRMNAGRNGTRLNSNAICFIPKLNLAIKSSLSKSNLGREGLLYNILCSI